MIGDEYFAFDGIVGEAGRANSDMHGRDHCVASIRDYRDCVVSLIGDEYLAFGGVVGDPDGLASHGHGRDDGLCVCEWCYENRRKNKGCKQERYPHRETHTAMLRHPQYSMNKR